MAAVVVLAAAACQPARGHPPRMETGVVISAGGPSAAQVDSFRLRTPDGRVLDFKVGRLDVSNGGLPAPHLRDHLVSGEPITVFHYGDEGAYEAVRYVDAQ